MPTFDGANLVVTLDSGVTTIDIQDDLYEAWKDWMLESPANRKYPVLFDILGSQVIDLATGVDTGAIFFLRNDLGWRIKPPEEDITIYAIGNLAPKDSTLPIIRATDGAYSAGVFGLQPVVRVVNVEVGSGLSAEEQTKLDELHKLQGLDASNPMTVTPTSRAAGTISQVISGDGENTTTVTRQ